MSVTYPQRVRSRTVCRCRPAASDTEWKGSTMADKRMITGNVAADPELVQFQNGKQIASFRIAEDNGYSDRKTGKWVEQDPTWYNVSVEDDRLRQNVMDSVRSGQKVTVEGNYKPEAFISKKTGEAALGHKLYAKNVAVSLVNQTAQVERNPDLNRGPGRGEPQWGRENPSWGSERPGWDANAASAQSRQYDVPGMPATNAAQSPNWDGSGAAAHQSQYQVPSRQQEAPAQDPWAATGGIPPMPTQAPGIGGPGIG